MIENQNYINRAKKWTTSPFDSETQNEVKNLINNNLEQCEEAFYKDLEFGTGGIRGIMGVGTNRINKYTLGRNTQGLSDYLHQQFPNEEIKVAIAFDCRNNSQSLAQIVADIFSANGILVYLYESLRPTPQLSFTVRNLGCHAGVVLTASHNPPEYNGYKVYWQDGGQLVPPQDQELIKVIHHTEFKDIKFQANPNLIKVIGEEIDEKYQDAALQAAKLPLSQEQRNQLKIVFTPLHGTSIMALPQVLKKAGYHHVHIVESQAKPNGNFPTVASPNPEEPAALEEAMKLAEEINADVVIGTDPDADRVGIAVRNSENKLVLLNGNQTMVLLTAFYLNYLKQQQKIEPNKHFIASTIVSTPMMFDIAEEYGIECKVGLTGFKWIAKFIKDFPEKKFICGGEESFGFMLGDFVRDKDAITSALLFCEIAALAKSSNSSVYQELMNLYLDFGYYKEHLLSITKKGKKGAEEITEIMNRLRNHPPKTINDNQLIYTEDYLNSIAHNKIENTTEPLHLPKSNVLIYYTEDGTRIAIRPSGTEPKIKIYYSAKQSISSITDIEEADKELMQLFKNITQELNII